MIRLARSLGYSCILAAAALALAADELEVRVERKRDVFLVQAAVPVAVDPATAWQVLTDYNRLAEFVPDMRVSRVVSAPGEPILLEQHGESGFLFFRTEIRVVLRIEEDPLRRIVFRSVGGNIERMQGEWRVVRDADAIRLSYRAEIEPEFWVPPLLGDAILKGHVEKQISGVVKEMLRRYAEARGTIVPSGRSTP
ncbi:MAG: hypothetical protein EHM59_02705 [Betaproteobacteria bacterium]|nr:MAG: hypothetical protein EHM59_02705 [Betaproteobacteria bacterium]